MTAGRRIKWTAWVLTLAGVLAGNGRAAEDEAAVLPIADLKRDTPVDFQKEILPIFKANCLACHNEAKGRADLVLETPKSIAFGSESGDVVAPGNGAESLLVKTVRHQAKPHMPPANNKVGAKPLTPQQIALIKLWIDQGAKGEVKSLTGPVEWQPLPPGLNPIYTVAVSPDGQYVAAGRANQIFIYHVPTKRLVTRLTDPALVKEAKDAESVLPGVAHRDLVQSLQFSHDGRWLASGGYRVVKLWRRNDGEAKQFVQLGGHGRAVAAGPDGKTAAVAIGNDVRLVDVPTGNVVRELKGHTGEVRSVRFSADGLKLITGSADRTIRLWNAADGKEIGRLDTPKEVAAIEWLKDDSLIVAASHDDKDLHVWQAPQGPAKQLAGVPSPVTAATLSRDRKWLALGGADGRIVIVDTASGNIAKALEGHKAKVTALDFRHDGAQLVSGGEDKAVFMWNVNEGKPIADLAAALHKARTDAKAKAKAEADEKAKAAEEAKKKLDEKPDDGGLKQAFENAQKEADEAKKKADELPDGPVVDAAVTAVASNPGGNQVAVAWGNGAIQLWKSDNEPAQQHVIKGVEKPVTKLLYSSGGDVVFAASQDGTVRGFGTNDGNQRFSANHGAPVHDLAYSADGRYLASAGENKEVKLWNAGNGSPAGKHQYGGFAGAVTSVALSHDGKSLVAGSAGNEAIVFNTDTGAPEQAFAGHGGAVTALAFVGDQNQMVASASADKTVRQWSRLYQRSITGHGGPVTSLAAIPTSKEQFISGSKDGTIRHWNVDNGQQVRQINHGSPVVAVAVRPDGQRFAAASENNAAKLFRADNGQQIAELKQPRTDRMQLAAAQRYTQLTAEHVGYFKGQADEMGKRVKAEDDAVKKADEAMKKADEEMTKQVEAFNKAKEAKEKAEKDFTTAQEELKKATAEKEAADKALPVAQEAQKQAQAKQNDANNAFNQANQNKQNADNTVNARTNEMNAAKTKVDQAKQALDQKPDDQGLKDALANAEKELAAKTEELNKAQEEQKKAVTALGQAQQDKESADKAKAEADQKLQEATKAKQEADQALNNANNKKNQAKQQVDRQEKPFNDARAAFEQAERNKMNADNALAAAKDALGRAQEAEKQAQASHQAAEQEKKKADEQHQALQKQLNEMQPVAAAVAFSPDNQMVLTGGDGNGVRTWSAEDGESLSALEGHKGAVSALAVTRDGVPLSLSADQTLGRWDLAAPWTLARSIGSGGEDSPLADRVISLAFSRDNKTLATGGGQPSRSGEVKLWKVEDGALVRELTDAHSDTVFGLEFSHDDQYLATCAADKFVKTWKAATGEHVRSFEGHTHHVLDVSWAADGRTLMSAGADSVVKVWDFVNGGQQRTISGYNKEVTRAVYIGVSDTALTVSGDPQVRIVRENGQNVRGFGGASDFIYAAAVTPDGKTVVAGGQDSILRVWNGDNGQTIINFDPPKPVQTADKSN